VEQLLVEIHQQLPRFAKPGKEAAEKVILDFLPLRSFSKLSIRLSKAAYRLAYPSYFLR